MWVNIWHSKTKQHLVLIIISDHWSACRIWHNTLEDQLLEAEARFHKWCSTRTKCLSTTKIFRDSTVTESMNTQSIIIFKIINIKLDIILKSKDLKEARLPRLIIPSLIQWLICQVRKVWVLVKTSKSLTRIRVIFKIMVSHIKIRDGLIRLKWTIRFKRIQKTRILTSLMVDFRQQRILLLSSIKIWYLTKVTTFTEVKTHNKFCKQDLIKWVLCPQIWLQAIEEAYLQRDQLDKWQQVQILRQVDKRLHKDREPSPVDRNKGLNQITICQIIYPIHRFSHLE